MSDPIEVGARAAAQRLAPEHGGPRLIADVEAALYARDNRDASAPPAQYLDPLELGIFIVAVATLARDIYNNHRTKTDKPSTELVTRSVQVQLRETYSTEFAKHERAATITIQETLNAARADEPE
jgi:hypothetical protein